jgi:hypothetical protein
MISKYMEKAISVGDFEEIYSLITHKSIETSTVQLIVNILDESQTMKQFIQINKEKYNIINVIKVGIQHQISKFVKSVLKYVKKFENTGVLMFAKNVYELDKNSETKSIYRIIQKKYRKFEFDNKSQKNFCVNIESDKSNKSNRKKIQILEPYRQEIIQYKILFYYVFQPIFEKITFENACYKLYDDSIKKSMMSVTQTFDNYDIGMFGKYFANNFDFDTEWLQNQIKYLYQLSVYEKYTLSSYTAWDNMHFHYFKKHDNIEEMKTKIADQIKQWYENLNNSKHNPSLESKWFIPFLYQFYKVLEIEPSNLEQLIITLNELRQNNISKLIHVVTNVLTIANQDIQQIIDGSPPLTKAIILYQKQMKPEYPTKGEFVSPSLLSTYFTVSDSYVAPYKPCCIIQFIMRPGDKCLFLEPITSSNEEYEVLINVNHKFQVERFLKETNFKNRTNNIDSEANETFEDYVCHFSNETINVITYMSK